MRVCVGGALYHDGKILLGLRSKAKRLYPGTWDVVGGHCGSGESVEETLVREFREELGVVPTDFECIGVFDEPRPDEYGQAIYHMFVVRGWLGEPQNMSDEHQEVCWFSVERISELNLASREYIDLFKDLREHTP